MASAGLQLMLNRVADQKEAEVLATRLSLLKQQELRVLGQTEMTRVRLQDLSAAKERQERHILEKEDALRQLHRADPAYQIHCVTQERKVQALPAFASSPVAAALPVVAGDDALAKFAREAALAGSGPLALAPPALVLSPQLQPPRLGDSLQAPNSARPAFTPRQGVSSQSLNQFQSPRILSARLQTSDIVTLAHAQVAAKCNLAGNRREKARLGAYVGIGCERIFMTPALAPGGGARVRDATIPGQIARMDPKDLVAKMTKKEGELKERLESARRAQLLADSELESSFKSFSAMQVSARKAIRDGTY